MPARRFNGGCAGARAGYTPVVGSVTYRVVYRFRFKDGRVKEYALAFDPATMDLIPRRGEPPPDWARLEHRQCAGCPLSAGESPYCPPAAGLSHLVDHFMKEISHTPARIEVETPERTFVKDATLQEGLASLFGLVMATSGCPILDVFKPMARFHLPFATNRETSVRSVSSYLLRQYFAALSGGKPDLDLSGLQESYARVQDVNQGIAERLRSVGGREGEADGNAVAILDIFCLVLSSEIEDKLPELAPLFAAKPEAGPARPAAPRAPKRR